MDIKLVNPFLDATVNVLSTMAFTEASAGKPFLKKTKEASGDVTGTISFTGDATGILAITFTEGCIANILTNMFGEEVTGINDEVCDAVGELTNMISGDARRKLEQYGYSIRAAIPSVITGKNHTIKKFFEGPCIALPFSTNGGDFTVEIAVKTKSNEEPNS